MTFTISMPPNGYPRAAALAAASASFEASRARLCADGDNDSRQGDDRVERAALRYLANLLRCAYPQAAILTFAWDSDDALVITGAKTARGRAITVDLNDPALTVATTVRRHHTSWGWLANTALDAPEVEFEMETLLAIPEEPSGDLASPEAEEMFRAIFEGEACGYSALDIQSHLADHQQTLRDLNAGILRPSDIIGFGHKDSRKVATSALKEAIVRCRIDLATQGRSNYMNRLNVPSLLRAAG